MGNNEEFKEYLKNEGRSKNTIKSYLINIQEYKKWYSDSFGLELKKLYRENILDFKSYLINVKKFNGHNLNAKTVNAKVASIMCLNKYLVDKNIQKDMVVNKEDLMRIQRSIANPCIIEKQDVEQFRQKILESGDKRLYCITTLLSYAGLRISECLNIKLSDFNLITKEIRVVGKGSKQRIVYINDKIVAAMKGYLKERKDSSYEYLFASRQSEKVDRTVINKQFKKNSDVITPHMLRHFYCSNLIDNGFTISEVANLAGHSNANTSLLYTNPSIRTMKEKIENL